MIPKINITALQNPTIDGNVIDSNTLKSSVLKTTKHPQNTQENKKITLKGSAENDLDFLKNKKIKRKLMRGRRINTGKFNMVL